MKMLAIIDDLLVWGTRIVILIGSVAIAITHTPTSSIRDLLGEYIPIPMHGSQGSVGSMFQYNEVFCPTRQTAENLLNRTIRNSKNPTAELPTASLRDARKQGECGRGTGTVFFHARVRKDDALLSWVSLNGCEWTLYRVTLKDTMGVLSNFYMLFLYADCEPLPQEQGI